MSSYQDVMAAQAPVADSPLSKALQEFVIDQVWTRGVLTRRERRIIAISSVAFADSPQPIVDQVYAALKTGDLTTEELLELVLHFAVYCGWPKASHLEGVIREQREIVAKEAGEVAPPLQVLSNDTLGLNNWDERLARGAKEFADVNHVPAPTGETPYSHAGILNFVFGHVWMRPGISRRDRRLITVVTVGVDDSPMPIWAHVFGALKSGDLSKEDMDELILQFAAYSGFAKAERLQATADHIWEKLSNGETPTPIPL